MRSRNILYDRDEGGDFFQLYSQTYGEGFFFEIVERRGGYRGYGAANAPFRIAAQKRRIRPKGHAADLTAAPPNEGRPLRLLRRAGDRFDVGRYA